MPDLDRRIRMAIVELLDSAPAPPPAPSLDAGRPHRPRHRGAMVVALATVTALLVGTVAVVSTRGSDEPDRVVTGAATAGPVAVLGCATVIGSTDRPGPGRTAVLGRVGLSTKRALQSNQTGSADPTEKLFAKDGLLVKRQAPFELIVPRLWRDRVGLEWGNTVRTDHLKFTGCPANTPGAKWLAFAGGYYVPKPACVPLIVKTPRATQRVRIGVGKACPGQQPPAPGV
jgi:hypothetical protein